MQPVTAIGKILPIAENKNSETNPDLIFHLESSKTDLKQNKGKTNNLRDKKKEKLNDKTKYINFVFLNLILKKYQNVENFQSPKTKNTQYWVFFKSESEVILIRVIKQLFSTLFLEN
jgi:hypothetical protein